MRKAVEGSVVVVTPLPRGASVEGDLLSDGGEEPLPAVGKAIPFTTTGRGGPQEGIELEARLPGGGAGFPAGSPRTQPEAVVLHRHARGMCRPRGLGS